MTTPISGGYRLNPSQVPDFPESKRWTEQLRWCLAVMNHDLEEIGFVAGLLAYASKHGGLTEKQELYAGRLVERIADDWAAEKLDCQTQAVSSAKHSGNVVPLRAERRTEALNP